MTDSTKRTRKVPTSKQRRLISCFVGFFVILIVAAAETRADTTLIGQDIPNNSVLDGDFTDVRRAPWRAALQSPDWTTKIIEGEGMVGLAAGRMMNNGAPMATIESPVLDHTDLKSLTQGDVLAWRFASNTEYPCDGRVSLAIVFQDQVRTVASRVKVPNGPDKPKIYEGFYTVTKEDQALGMPKIRFTLETTHRIKVYIDWVDLRVLSGDASAPRQLAANAIDAGIELTWNGDEDQPHTVYRSADARTDFEKVAEDIRGNRWVDTGSTSGRNWFYAVRQGNSTSQIVSCRKVDVTPPTAPKSLNASGSAWETKLSWKTDDDDVAFFKVYRRDTKPAEGATSAADGNMVCIAPKVTRNRFTDDLPVKGVPNVYAVQAVDYSGNEGPLSETASATTRAVRGASFSDLILPMPIHKQLRADIWGGDNVLPRDPDNGVEDPFWSYWGGKVTKDPVDGKFHILVVRWPENDRKGHWAWPYSTVAHAVSDNPTGPYRIEQDLVYDHQEGSGHNANIIELNDGRFALYSLIHFVPMMFTSDTMSGPWKLEGEIEVNYDNPLVDPKRHSRYTRNLSGIQQKNGNILIATKSGAMMHSTNGLLGPYEALSADVNHNTTVPKYLKTNYEDPAFWYDGVQYHLLINANHSERAIYLRSPNGVEWKYETGFAFTPTCTVYEDGTRTFWDKVERPNVLQDEFGRATHLSLAVIDSPKADDFGGDNHSSKHLILPLVVNRRMTMLNEQPVTAQTKEIRVLIHCEPGFDPAGDLELASLRFGGSEAVNFGGGAKLTSSASHDKGLVLVFDGAENGMSAKNFVCKLIGKTKTGDLVVGYCAPGGAGKSAP